MLLDRQFPRSAFYSLKLAEHSLDELMRGPSDGTGAEARRALGRARSELEFVRPGRCWTHSRSGWRACRRPVSKWGEAHWPPGISRLAPWVEWTDAGCSAAVMVADGGGGSGA